MAFGSTLALERAYPETTWIQRASRGANSDQSALYFAEAPSGLVGLGGIVWFEHRWNVVSMWIDPAWRGRRLGGQLVDALVRWLDGTHPGSSLWLDVGARQRSARRLYVSRGFRPTGRVLPLEHTPSEKLYEMVRRPRAFPADGLS
ncbi:MAG TPA: GNAT family N-acetyltransferase [Thermoplasmata archaeon]|nr:GNAT family N-acetyltransferase [Thermoplasmata archaeon]